MAILSRTVTTEHYITHLPLDVKWEYVEEGVIADFVYMENEDGYSAHLFCDNLNAEALARPSCVGKRVHYENGEKVGEEDAGYSSASDIVASDIGFSANFSAYIDENYGENMANGILQALKDSVTAHHFTHATIVSGDMVSGILKEVRTDYDALVETTNRANSIMQHQYANYIPDISLEWAIWNDFYLTPSSITPMPYAMALAILNVNSDIANNIITVPPEVADILEDTIPKAGIQSKYRVTWYVNIDGTKNPIISVSWDGIDETLVDKASVRCTVLNHQEHYGSITQPYKDQPITKTWNELYGRKGDNESKNFIDDLLDVAVSGLGALTGALGIYPRFNYEFQCTYTTRNLAGEKTEVKTSQCYAVIASNGSCDEYGVYKSERQDGSKVVVSFRDTDDFIKPFTDMFEPISDPIKDDPSNPKAVSGLGIFTKTYYIKPAQLKKLGAFLWQDDFYNHILQINQNPIENILSCKVYPVNIPHSQSDTYIKLGNVITDASGYPVTENTNVVIDINPNGYTVPELYHNWLDYEATKITAFLPFISYVDIPCSKVMGKKIKFQYFIDVITGVCKAVLYSYEKQENTQNYIWVPVNEYNGQIGFDIPVSAQNRAQQELAQITSFAGGIASGMTGNLLGLVSGMAGGVIRPKDDIRTSGSASPTCNMMTTHDVFLTIERPIVQYPSNYARTYGYPCYLTLTLGKCKGFTQCEGVDVKGVSATDTEKDLIKQALEKGVYVQ